MLLRLRRQVFAKKECSQHLISRFSGALMMEPPPTPLMCQGRLAMIHQSERLCRILSQAVDQDIRHPPESITVPGPRSTLTTGPKFRDHLCSARCHKTEPRKGGQYCPPYGIIKSLTGGFPCQDLQHFDLTPNQTDRRSSPWSKPQQSHAQTQPVHRPGHRLRPGRAIASWSQTPSQPLCPST